MTLHLSVLKKEVLDALWPSPLLIETLVKLTPRPTFFFLDATLGFAGHTLAFIERFAQEQLYQQMSLCVIGLDQDPFALETSLPWLKNCKNNYSEWFDFYTFHTNFSNISDILKSFPHTLKHPPAHPHLHAHSGPLPLQHPNLHAHSGPLAHPHHPLHALCGDFGVSSPQLDKGERGFSFSHEGPLDMRMNTTVPFTAQTILETYTEEQLVKILFDYGEEPKARKVARAIVQDRRLGKLPKHSTVAFAEYIKRILCYHNSRTHPATRTFQALRIEVNQEISSIEKFLSDVPQAMAPHSKAAFISFHSLEDRVTKRALRHWQQGQTTNKHDSYQNLPSPYALALHINRKEPFGKEIPRGGICAQQAEIQENPRSRSARLRCFAFSPTHNNP
jgi:16S rRNA (cytosine1402-N4)-methyltransferase